MQVCTTSASTTSRLSRAAECTSVAQRRAAVACAVAATGSVSASRIAATSSVNTACTGCGSQLHPAIAGAVISSLASMLNSAATIFTMDVYRRHLRPQASDRRIVAIGRAMTVLFVVIGCLLAPVLADPRFNGVFNFIQEFQGYISPGILAAFLLEPASEDGYCAWNFFDPNVKTHAAHPVRRVMAAPSVARTPVR